MRTRTHGRSAMYKLNRQNPAVQPFVAFYWDLAHHSARKQLRTQATSLARS